MSALGRWMAPCEIVEQAAVRCGRDVADLSIAEEARLEKFALSFCEVSEGSEIHLVPTANQDLIGAMAHGLGITLKAVAG